MSFCKMCIRDRLHGLRRDAQDLVRAELFAGLARGEVALAHVRAVRAAGERQVHVVVHDKGNAHFAAERADLPALGEEGRVVQVLFTQLHERRAALDGVAHAAKERLARLEPGAVRHRVEEKAVLIAIHSVHAPEVLRG